MRLGWLWPRPAIFEPVGTLPDVTEADLEARREQAQLRVEDLVAELAAIAQSTAESPDDEHDAEGSTIGYERARITGLLARSRADLAECDAALVRSQVGTYGTCRACGVQIPAERLAALPATTLCVGCARSGSADKKSC